MTNWLGIKGIEHIWNGAWSDPEIMYKGYIFNEWDVQEDLGEMYDEYVKSGYIKPYKDGWKEWASKNPKTVKAELDDLIYAGCATRVKKPKKKQASPFGL